METKVTINIAQLKKGPTGREGYHHFFKVDVKGQHLLSENPDFHPAQDFKKVLNSIKANYPAPQFNITLTEWKVEGTIIK